MPLRCPSRTTVAALVFALAAVCFLSSFSLSQRVRGISPCAPIPPLKRFDHTLPFESLSPIAVAHRTHNVPDYEKLYHRFYKLFVVDYIAWHRRQRLRAEQNVTHARTLRLLVYRGDRLPGLGDLTRSILHGYLMAVASDRLFLIEVLHPFPLSSVFENAPGLNTTFDAKLFTACPRGGPDVEDILASRPFDEFFSPKRVAVLYATPPLHINRMLRRIRDRPELHIAQRLNGAGIAHFTPHVPGTAALLLQALFRAAPALRAGLRQQRSFGRRDYVALHARFGLGVGEGALPRFSSPVSGSIVSRDVSGRSLPLPRRAFALGRLAAALAVHHGSRRLFFSTDTRWANKWIERGARAECGDVTLAFGSRPAWHFRSVRHYNLQNDEQFESFLQVFIDVGLLGGARTLLSMKSGFADLGTWIGGMHTNVRVTWEDCAQLVRGNATTGEILDRRIRIW